jgi:hypothetical protein
MIFVFSPHIWKFNFLWNAEFAIIDFDYVNRFTEILRTAFSIAHRLCEREAFAENRVTEIASRFVHARALTLRSFFRKELAKSRLSSRFLWTHRYPKVDIALPGHAHIHKMDAYI